MEFFIFNILKRYFQVGGFLENVIQFLFENYIVVVQIVNLLVEWFIQIGVELVQVQEIVENYLKSLLIKYFDFCKVDFIFIEEGEILVWLEQMIVYIMWWDFFYKLVEVYLDCLMLNFIVKFIFDVGYQGEIISVFIVCQQLEVFLRVFWIFLVIILDGGEENFEKNFFEFVKMVCYGEYMYLFVQVMMFVLVQEEQGGFVVCRIVQEVQCFVQEKGYDVSQIILVLGIVVFYFRVCQVFGVMLFKGVLNFVDIIVLFKMFISMDFFLVEFICVLVFLDLFMQLFFKLGVWINQDYKYKYIYILVYVVSVVEIWKKNK